MAEEKGSFEEDARYRKLFVEEAEGMLRELERGLAQLRGHPESTDLLNEMRRLAHTIKGNASMMEFEEIRRLGEKMQTSIEELRDGKKEISNEIIDALLEDLGGLRVLVGSVAKE